MGLFGGVLALVCTGCASLPFTALGASAAPAADVRTPLPEDDDITQLIAQFRSDLNRTKARELTRTQTLAPAPQSARLRDSEFADRARALFTPLSGAALHMPVVGIKAFDLDDSWHAPRDGGARVHKGIDIFASRGTPVVAVADGIVSYIGDQHLGGHCVWLTTENGTAFYYAHLERWAAGM
jgi:murein DD-endopeptidase MepM/ murein hydrolase activator NlpD